MMLRSFRQFAAFGVFAMLVGCGARSYLDTDEDEDATADATTLDASSEADSVDESNVEDVSLLDVEVDVVAPSCPAACTSNHECESQCTPALESGRYCCDEQTSICYASSGATCPVSVSDAGFD